MRFLVGALHFPFFARRKCNELRIPARAEKTACRKACRLLKKTLSHYQIVGGGVYADPGC